MVPSPWLRSAFCNTIFEGQTPMLLDSLEETWALRSDMPNPNASVPMPSTPGGFPGCWGGGRQGGTRGEHELQGHWSKEKNPIAKCSRKRNVCGESQHIWSAGCCLKTHHRNNMGSENLSAIFWLSYFFEYSLEYSKKIFKEYLTKKKLVQRKNHQAHLRQKQEIRGNSH